MIKNTSLHKLVIFLQIIFLVILAFRQSESLSPFFDEIISITANYNFFTSGNFFCKALLHGKL